MWLLGIVGIEVVLNNWLVESFFNSWWNCFLFKMLSLYFVFWVDLILVLYWDKMLFSCFILVWIVCEDIWFIVVKYLFVMVDNVDCMDISFCNMMIIFELSIFVFFYF